MTGTFNKSASHRRHLRALDEGTDESGEHTRESAPAPRYQFADYGDKESPWA